MKKLLTTIGLIIIACWLLGFSIDAGLHLAGALLLALFWGAVVLGILGIGSVLWEKLVGSNPDSPKQGDTTGGNP